MKERKILSAGFCYIEIREATQETSKAGVPMVKMSLMVTDKNGEIGFVYDYIVKTFVPKIINVKNSLMLNEPLWTGKEFNVKPLINKSCGGVLEIKHSEQYGTSNGIKTYLPLSFYNLLNQKAPSDEPANAVEQTQSSIAADDDYPF